MTNQQADFTDPQTGTDLNIIMTDAEFNGHVYKQISAITTKGKSPLHGDPTIMRAWLDDDISWRDVFKPKKVPNITPYEYLQMCVAGTTPYWEDSDQNNKHWVFPGRPDLEEKANTRTVNLDNNDEEFEQASDLEEQKSPRVTISNITESKVGEFKDDASDIGKEAMSEKSSNDSSNDSDDNYEESDDDVNTNESDDGSDYDDLPF